MYSGVCSEEVSEGALVESGKNLLVNVHNCRSCPSLVETGGLGMDARRKVLVWCLVRQLPGEPHRESSTA